MSTEVAATCPVRQYAINESGNGSFGCASASNTNYLTTQTAVSTELSNTCPAGQFAKGEDSGGNMICNTPSSNIQGIGTTNGVTVDYFLLSTSSATETNVETPVANNGVLSGFYCDVQSSVVGTVTWIVRMGNAIVMSNTALNVTQVNPTAGFVYSDITHTVNIAVGNFIDFSVKMSVVGAFVTQCGLSFSKS